MLHKFHKICISRLSIKLTITNNTKEDGLLTWQEQLSTKDDCQREIFARDSPTDEPNTKRWWLQSTHTEHNWMWLNYNRKKAYSKYFMSSDRRNLHIFWSDGQSKLVSIQPPRPTQPPTLNGIGNKWWPEWSGAPQLESKGRRGSFHLWMHVWVTDKNEDLLSTCAIPERKWQVRLL